MIKINRSEVRTITALLLAVALLVLSVPQAKAEDFFSLEPIAKDASADLVVSARSASVRVPSQRFDSDGWMKMTSLIPKEFIHSYFQYPETISPQTDLYSIRFPEGLSFASSSRPQVRIKYDKSDPASQLYFYNWGAMEFQKAEATKDATSSEFVFDYPAGKSFLMFAVFGSPYEEGKASWYVHPKYEGQLIAASRDLPIGSKARVTNLENGKSTVVTIRDFGPKLCADWTEREQKLMGPCQDRIIDLSKTAFSSIAKTSQGVINVKVSPITQ